jgi:hypothetical protein
MHPRDNEQKPVPKNCKNQSLGMNTHIKLDKNRLLREKIAGEIAHIDGFTSRSFCSGVPVSISRCFAFCATAIKFFLL